MIKPTVPILLLTALSYSSNGQNQPPTALYLNTVNSYLAPSPESAQLMKYQDYPVNLFTGTAQVSVPVYTCSGKGISVPVSISYHAAGGIKTDDQATNIGLGFSLLAGGEITREMRGGPDESGSGTSGYIDKPHKIAEYVNRYESGMGTYDDFQLWVEAMNGHADVEPDIFYFNFGGYSGKFVYDDVPEKFVCLDEKAHLDIQFDKSNMPNSKFTIIADDGNRYIFAARETSSSSSINKGLSGGQTNGGPETTTSWKLTKIINADRTDSIMINYVSQTSSYWTTGANIVYETVSGPTRNPLISYSNTTIGGQSKLSSITGTNFSVEFLDGAADRQDLPAGNKALSKIVIKNNNVVQDIFVLHQSYFDRAASIGTMPVDPNSTLIRKSLRLDSISEYGNSESNANPLRYAFSYDNRQLPARLSWAKDWWGYPNFNYNDNSLVPPFISQAGVSYSGANRTPNFDRTGAGILTEVRMPTGGTVAFEYEPNTTAIPIQQASPPENQLMSVGQTITQPAEGSTTYQNIATKTFTINVPPNDALNQNMGGVLANISFFPAATGQPSGSGFVNGIPYYALDKTSNIPGSNTQDFHRFFQASGEMGVYLPNGNYTMTYYNNNYNPPHPDTSEGEPVGGSFAFFTVAYNAPDPNAPFPNYSLAGLRVKMITSKDPYRRTEQTRRFRYHDPATDSSYGYYVGMARSSFNEVSQYGQWIVRNGSFNMPGQGNVSNSIVYPKVIEDITDNGVTHRTEHYFTMNWAPSYPMTFPFAPALDFESRRGNEYKTVIDRQTSTGFIPAALSVKKFNQDPVNQSTGLAFSRPISVLKCAATSYDEALVVNNGYAPPFVGVYQIAVGNRVYLESDSSSTYDLNSNTYSINQWHDYKYGDYSQQPTLVRTGTSDGSILTQKNYYPADRPDVDNILGSSSFTNLSSQLIAANRITLPLAVKQYRDGVQLSRQYTYARFDGSRLLTDSMQQALYSDNPETEVKVLAYDAKANPLLIAMRGDKYRRYIWNPFNGLALATCVMRQSNTSFAFTSFEYPGEYSWNEAGRGTANAFAGSYSYDLSYNPITFPGFVADGLLDVYVWATSNDVSVNNNQMESTGRTKANWTLYTKRISVVTPPPPPGTSGLPGSQIYISGTAKVDNLVIVPVGSQFTGNVYDSQNRVIAMESDGMVTSFYQYDAFGRLQNIRDEQGNVLKSNTYQYQGAQ